MSTVLIAVASAAGGALGTGIVSYVGWRVSRPLERRDALIQKRMNDRWDASVAIRAALAEMDHACDHIVHPIDRGPAEPDDDAFYRERASSYRQRARELARKSVPLLGEDVRDAVVEYTDLREEAIAAFDAGEMDPAGFDEGRLQDHVKLDLAITRAFKSLPRP